MRRKKIRKKVKAKVVLIHQVILNLEQNKTKLKIVKSQQVQKVLELVHLHQLMSIHQILENEP